MDQYTKYRVLWKGTKAEVAFEDALCRLGVPYRWQAPCWKYIFDFALPRDRVYIEVDGSSHDKPEQKIKDAEKAAYAKKQGWRVVRCRNEDVFADPIGTVNSLMQAAGLPYRLEREGWTP